MPFRVRPDTRQPVWRVNDKMEPLDEMYDRFIGRAGDAAKGQEGVQGTKGSELLPEEVKVRAAKPTCSVLTENGTDDIWVNSG